NHTMIRKSSVYSGVQSNPSFFNPALEWDTLPNNDWSDLGQHSYLYTTFATFQVVDENGSVANAQINISDEQLITDENGFDSIPLLSGSYPFEVLRAGYDQYNGTLEMLENDTTLLIELTQSSLYTVTFTVNGLDELPIPNANILIGGETLTTDSEGNTSVILGNGTWGYEVSASEYQTVNQEVVVDGGQTNETVVLSPMAYSFDVYVHYDIDPIINATVEINGETASTNAEGICSFMLIDGTYSLAVSKEGYQIHSTEFEINGEASSINVELMPYYEVKFQVLNASQPIEGAQIIIDTLERYTDEQGIATFELMNGLYNYDVVTDEFTTRSGSIDVSGSDVEKVIDFTGIQEFGTTFNVYPNPTTSTVIIESEGNGVATIYNSTGQMIDAKPVKGELTYSFTKPGIYLVKLSDNQSTEIVKVIVE
nr:T9SS type A sorting domain-containing protein [Salinivirgaceae bacterium]